MHPSPRLRHFGLAACSAPPRYILYNILDPVLPFLISLQQCFGARICLHALAAHPMFPMGMLLLSTGITAAVTFIINVIADSHATNITGIENPVLKM